MATIIDLGGGRFIAGDPETILAPKNHWCEWCNGDGLDYDYDDDLTICSGCWGAGQIECEDAGCADHA